MTTCTALYFWPGAYLVYLLLENWCYLFFVLGVKEGERDKDNICKFGSFI